MTVGDQVWAGLQLVLTRDLLQGRKGAPTDGADVAARRVEAIATYCRTQLRRDFYAELTGDAAADRTLLVMLEAEMAAVNRWSVDQVLADLTRFAKLGARALELAVTIGSLFA